MARAHSTPPEHPVATHPKLASDDPSPSGWGPWIGLFALTLAFTLFSYLRTEGTIFADAVEYLERAFAFVRGELLIDAKQLRSAGITLVHLPALWISKVLSQSFGLDDTRWILPYAALVHVAITCLFVVATVHFGRALAEFVGRTESESRTVGWFAGLVALGSPTLLQFSAIPMADIGAAAALAYGLKRAFLGENTKRNGAEAGLGFGLAILAAFKTIPVVVVAAALTFVVRLLSPGEATATGEPATFGQRFRSTVKFAASGTVVLGAMIFIQCAFDQSAYGQFGIGLKNYVLANALPGMAAWFYKIGYIELGHTLYEYGHNAIESVSSDQISRDTSDLHQRAPATWYFDNFGDFAPRWTIPIFAFGVLVAAVRAALVKVPSVRGRIGRAISASAPWLAAGALIAATAMKGTKEMRIWLPMLPSFAAYSALGLCTLAGPVNAIAARLRGAAVAGVLIAVPIHGVVTLTSFTSTAMGSLARAAKWLNDYEPLQLASSRGHRPVVGASYHWSALFRVAPHLELIKLTNQPDGSFSHLATPEERERTLEEIRGLDAFIVHSSLLRIDGSSGAPELAWTRELVQALSENFHVAAAFWDRESDERLFGPILVLVRGEERNRSRRMLTSFGKADPRDDGAPIARMERPLEGIFEQVELEDAHAWWLPGDNLLWVELEFDQMGPRVIADYVMMVRMSDKRSDQGIEAIRRPGWNKRRTSELTEGTRWTEGMILAPYQGSIVPDDPTPAIREGSPIRLWLDLATLDRHEGGDLFPTGRLEPLDPQWRGRGPGQVGAERDQLDPKTGVSNDGFRFTGDFGHLLVGEVPPPERELDKRGSGNVLRVETALRAQ
jgi:hypothetical protein